MYVSDPVARPQHPARLPVPWLKRGAIFRPSTVLTPTEFSRWAGQKADDVAALAGVVVAVLADDLTPACGAPGQPGDPAHIRQAVERLIEVAAHLVEWEIEVHFVRVDDAEVKVVKAMMSGWAEDALRQLEQMPNQIEQAADQAAPGDSYELTLTFHPAGHAERSHGATEAHRAGAC